MTNKDLISRAFEEMRLAEARMRSLTVGDIDWNIAQAVDGLQTAARLLGAVEVDKPLDA